MTAGDLSETVERRLVRVMQAALAVLVVYGLATLRVGMALNAAVALAATFLPAALRREYGYSMDAGLVLLITVAVFLHAVGTLGPYGRFSWYDEVTHTVSATLVAGVGYAVLRAFERHSAEVEVPSEFRAAFVLVFVLAVGVVWEVFEFAAVVAAGLVGVDPPVRVFGIDDIVTDTIFNAVGAVVVAVWGSDRFGGLVPVVGRWLRSADDES